jgi:hypothetical protein
VKEVYVVLHEDFDDNKITVLDVYTNETKANERVIFERGLTDENVWYQAAALKGSDL